MMIDKTSKKHINKNYVIEKLSKNKLFIFYISTDDFSDFYKGLQKKLEKEKFDGTIYVDQLSIVHNDGYNRFFKIAFKNNSFDFTNAKHIKGSEKFKKITSYFFNQNKDYLDNTILYESEKKKILNNEII